MGPAERSRASALPDPGRLERNLQSFRFCVSARPRLPVRRAPRIPLRAGAAHGHSPGHHPVRAASRPCGTPRIRHGHSKVIAMTEDRATKASAALAQASSNPQSPPPQIPDAREIEDFEGKLRTAMSRVEGVLADALGLRERPIDRGDLDTATRLAYD